MVSLWSVNRPNMILVCFFYHKQSYIKRDKENVDTCGNICSAVRLSDSLKKICNMQLGNVSFFGVSLAAAGLGTHIPSLLLPQK